MSSSHSPFDWRNNPEPSIFAGDKAFSVNRDGKTASEIASNAVSTYERKVGKSRGTIKGLSAKGDQQIRRRQK